MNSESYLNDPSEIYSALKPAWKSYKTKIGKHVATALGDVVEWKQSEDLILPLHPFSAFIDTTHPDGIWRDRRTLFVPEVKNPHRRVRHGVDESGQVIIAQREHSSTLVLRDQKHFDVVGAWHNKDGTFSQMPTRPYYVRYMLDDQLRIIAIWSYSPTEDDHLNVETFNWKKDRPVETYLQRFDGGRGLPSWTKDLPPERQAALYRQATKSYRKPSTAFRSN